MVMFAGIAHNEIHIITFLCDIIWNIIISLLTTAVGTYSSLKNMRKYTIFYDFHYVFEIWYNVAFSSLFNTD